MYMRSALVHKSFDRVSMISWNFLKRYCSRESSQGPSDDGESDSSSYYAKYNELFKNYTDFEKRDSSSTNKASTNIDNAVDVPEKEDAVYSRLSYTIKDRETSIKNKDYGSGPNGMQHSTIINEALSNKLTHTDDGGELNMVDVGHKEDSVRSAVAYSRIHLGQKTFNLVKFNNIKKGDVLTIAKIAGIMAAKNTSNLIPLCHPISLTKVDVNLELDEEEHSVNIYCTGRTLGKTGVEMEALTGASVAALTIYDMCKATNREMVIEETKLLKKTGGSRGDYEHQGT